MKTKTKTRTKTKKKKKKKKPAIRLPATARDMLDLIDRFLLARMKDPCFTKTEAAKLWDVLSALRGPDFDDGKGIELKAATTVPIRRVAFPRLTAFLTKSGVYTDIPAAFSGADALMADIDVIDVAEARVNARHFPHHIRAPRSRWG